MRERDDAAEHSGPQRIVEAITRAAAEHGDRDFIVTPTDRLSFAQADLESRALAKQFAAAGVGKGARVAAHLPHGPEWMVSFFAAARIGALFMPFSAAYKPAELRRALRLGDVQLLLASAESWHGGPYAAFLHEALPELASDATAPLCCGAAPYLREVWLFAAEAAPSWARSIQRGVGDPVASVTDELIAAMEEQVQPADEAIVIWTSGTTADPKGAVHSQGTVARRATANAQKHAFVAGDRVFCDYAFWWVGGLGYGFLPALHVGATILCVAKHERATTEAFLARERPTRVAGRLAPDIAGRVMAPGEGSAHMITPRGIGMTETFGPHSMFEPEPLVDVMAAPRSGLGPAIMGFERKIIDPDTGVEVSEGEEGELLVRGPGMMLGLYKREREDVFDAGGWYHTGDKSAIRDGIIHFVSRFTEMIKTSGSNVAPLEVELALLGLPEVQEPVVFGLADPQRGEQVVAVVVRALGVDVDVEKALEWVRSQLSNYKVPRHLFVLDDDEMPRLHSGKPDKRALHGLVSERLGAEGVVARPPRDALGAGARFDNQGEP